MIGTLDPVAVEPPHGKRQPPVRAAILQGNRRAILRTIHDHGFSEVGPCGQRAPEILGEAGGVPAIA